MLDKDYKIAHMPETKECLVEIYCVQLRVYVGRINIVDVDHHKLCAMRYVE
ncbi:MAG: hypothetical protein ACXW0H_00745 [Methylobacter sp.]